MAGAIVERTLTGMARTGVAETKRVKERKRAREEGGAGDVPLEPGNGEQMSDRQAVASGEDEKMSTNRSRTLKFNLSFVHACVS